MQRPFGLSFATLTLLAAVPVAAQTVSPEDRATISSATRGMRLDADKDDFVSRDEYLGDAGRRFRRLDENGDGLVEAAEIEAAASRIAKRIKAGMVRALSRGDADGDGKLSRAEADGVASKRFAGLDGDGDGKLAAADFRRRRPASAARDAGMTATAAKAEPAPGGSE